MNEYAKKIFEEYKEYFFGDELDEAHEKGHTEGLAAGLAEGRAEGDLDRAIKVAKEMLADGMSAEKISKYTELSIEQIEVLKV